MCSYLHDCCDAVKDTNAYIDLNKSLFIWEDIRTGNNDAIALCNFLAQRFGLDWLDKADIQKSNSRVLEIKGAGPRSVLIRLSNDRKKATVSYIKEEIELPVTERMAVRLNEPNAPYYKLIVQKPRQLDETYINDFIVACSRRVQQLILSIVSDNSTEPDTRRILAQDESFRQVLHDTKNQFDQGYTLFE